MNKTWKSLTSLVTIFIAIGSFSIPSVSAEEVNLIQNSSFEIQASDGSPANWSKNYWGSPVPTFKYLNTGRTGAGKSASVTLNRKSTGGADWGHTSVLVEEGASYRYSNWYKSNVATEIDAEFTDSKGKLSYALVATLPSSGNTWKQASSTLTIPADVTKVTVFHFISKKGTLTVDDFSLVKVETTPTPPPPTDPNLFNKGLVTLSFGDGLKSVFDNINLLGSLKSTQYIYTEPMFGATECAGACYEDFMNISNVKSLYNAVHEVASHTRSHPNLTAVSAVTKLFETDGSRLDLLREIGIPVSNLAYPYGESNTDVVAKLQSAGFVGARTVVPDDLNTRNTNRYALFARQVNGNTSFAEVKSWIDEAILSKKWLILVFHEIRNSCGSEVYCATPTTLSGIVSYLTTQNSNVNVVTVAQGLAQMNNNPVSNPGVPVIAQEDITVTTTSQTGAPVTFSPAVSDDDTGLSLTLNAFCTIANTVPDPYSGLIFPTVVTSGYTFSIGTTIVTCTATDTGGRIGTKTFTVKVTN